MIQNTIHPTEHHCWKWCFLISEIIVLDEKQPLTQLIIVVRRRSEKTLRSIMRWLSSAWKKQESVTQNLLQGRKRSSEHLVHPKKAKPILVHFPDSSLVIAFIHFTDNRQLTYDL